MPNEPKQKRQVAEVELLGTITLGKNTEKNSGLKLTVSNKDGKQLGTISIGAGSFKWRATRAEKTLYLQWPDFATEMEKIAEAKELRKKEKRRRAKVRKG